MRRLLVLAALAALLAGCSTSVPGSRTETTPTPETVIGKVATTPAVVGDPTLGKAVFSSNGCGACHTFTPAGSVGKIGPNLDQIAALAKKANQPVPDFIKSSIVDPGGYVESGYPDGVMPGNYGTSLTPKQIADLVAFLQKTS